MHDRGEGEHRFYGAPGRICGEDRHRAARMRGATSRAAQLRSQPGLQAPGKGRGEGEMPKHRETRRACSSSGCCALALRVETAWGWTGEGNPTTLYEGGSLCPYFVLPPAARWECSVTTAWFSSIIQPWQERECVSAQRHSRCTYLKKEGSRWADGALPKRPSTSQKVPEKRVKESLTCRPGELGGFPRRLCSGGRPLLPLALLLRGREPGVR